MAKYYPKQYNTPMKMMLTFLLLILFSGCSKPRGMPYELAFDKDGVGALGADTAFESSRIEALFPGMQARAFTRFESGTPYRVIQLFRASELLLSCYPDARQKYVGTIESESLHVSNPLGITIGDTLDPQRCLELRGDGKQRICLVIPHLEIHADEVWRVTRARWVAHD